MGGKALTMNRRVTTKEFYDTVDHIKQQFAPYTDRVEPLIPLSLKESHGDIDMLISEDVTVDVINRVASAVSVPERSRNGDTVHLAWPISGGEGYVQVDIKRISWEYIDVARSFLWYGDLGNLIGKIVRGRFSSYLRWNYMGLHRKLWTPGKDRLLDTILVSRDPDAIYRFLGFSLDRWKDGFATEEEVFECVVQSKYFHPDYFHPSNLRHDQKEDYKRPGYRRFLSWMDQYCDERPGMFSHPMTVLSEEEVIKELVDTFGSQVEVISEGILQNWKLRTEAHAKFSGKTVLALYPNLPGPKIGETVSYVRNLYGGECQDGWNRLIITPDEEITKHIHTYLAK